MLIKIAQRHCAVPADVLERADKEVQRLQRFESRLGNAELIFTEERHLRYVEGILSIDGADAVVAKGEGADHRAALDNLLSRLAKILRRKRERLVDHRGPSPEGQPESG